MTAPVIWLTGLSGSGKTTLGSRLYAYLTEHGFDAELLDGDHVRKMLVDGYGPPSIPDSNLRLARVAALLVKHDVYVVVCKISPYRELREIVAQEIPIYLEIYVKCPIEECARRDSKGLFARAKIDSELYAEISGLGNRYDEPAFPYLVLETDKQTPDESFSALLHKLMSDGWLPKVVPRPGKPVGGWS